MSDNVIVLAGNSKCDSYVSYILSNYSYTAYAKVCDVYFELNSTANYYCTGRGLKSELYFSIAFNRAIICGFSFKAFRKSLYLNVNAWSTKNRLLFLFIWLLALTS